MSADNITINNKNYHYNRNYNIQKPFGFSNDLEKIWIGKWGETHEIDQPFDLDYLTRGRLWFLDKEDKELQNVISFWNPNMLEIEEIKDLVSKIEKELGFKLNDWMIDLGRDYEAEEQILQNLYEYINIGKKTDVDFSVDYAEHTESPLNKKKRIIPKGLGSKKIKKYKDWQKPFESKLNENTDQLVFNGETYYVGSDDAYSFCYHNGKLKVSDERESHWQIVDDILVEEYPNYTDQMIDSENIDGKLMSSFKFKGRIWLDVNLISFWNYIDNDDLKMVLKDLSNYFNIDIDYSKWYIEDIDTEKVITISEFLEEETQVDEEKKLEREKLELMHLLDLKKKAKMKKPENFGSKAIKDKEKGAWRFAKTKYMGENVKSFVGFFNNNSYICNNIIKFEKMFESEVRINKKINIPDELYDVAKLYNDVGYDLYIVGGAVRDAIQGKEPHDFDLVTNALPEESKEILKDWKGGHLSKEEQGQNFGVLRLYTPNEKEGYEIAVYRKDISSGRDVKGDDEKVEIGHHITIEDDVKRRDITINALFYDINKEEIVDLVGGVDDLENGVIRAVGNPKERFEEDRLRILRLLRFTARTGSDIDKETSDAIKEDNRLRGISPTDDVSQERIIEEFFKMYDYAKQHDSQSMFIYYLNLLDEYDMFEQMFPEIKVKYKNKYSYFNEFIILADMFENNEDIEKKMMNVKFPSKISKIVSYLVRFKKDFDDVEKVYSLMKEKNRLDILDDLLVEYTKDQRMNMNDVNKFITYCNSDRISGKELMDQGFKGPEIGIEQRNREIKKFKDM
jgi:tRNA nucleotidyltransferase/poly(A) polymerase